MTDDTPLPQTANLTESPQTNVGAHDTETHHALFPLRWLRRWPILVIVSTVIVCLEATGHILVGLEGWSHGVEMVTDWISTAGRNKSGVPRPRDDNPAADQNVTRQPVRLTLASSETRPLDGYQFSTPMSLPRNLEPGPLLPAGAHTRLILQAADPTEIVEINRLAIQTRSIPVPKNVAIAYDVDPRRQPGFGSARPKQYYIRIGDSQSVEVTFVTEGATVETVQASNILPPKSSPVIVLDTQAGLQEVFDFNIAASRSGLYEVRFVASVLARGEEVEVQSTPIYIAHK